jgi:mRNA-binding protein PUF3
MLSQLKGSDREMFVDQIKAGLVQLKKFSYGKQVAAIEKIIFDSNLSLKSSLPSHHSLTELDTSVAPTPPLLTGATQSPQSSSLPSTSNSTVEGPVEPGMKATPLISDVSITTTTS